MSNPSETDTLLSSLHAQLQASDAECERLNEENERLCSVNGSQRQQIERLQVQLESWREEHARLSTRAEASGAENANESAMREPIITYLANDKCVYSWPAGAIREVSVFFTENEGYNLHGNGQRVSDVDLGYDDVVVHHEAFLQLMIQADAWGPQRYALDP